MREATCASCVSCSETDLRKRATSCSELSSACAQDSARAGTRRRARRETARRRAPAPPAAAGARAGAGAEAGHWRRGAHLSEMRDLRFVARVHAVVVLLVVRLSGRGLAPFQLLDEPQQLRAGGVRS